MLKVLPYLTFRYEYVVTDSDRVIFKLYISYIFYLKMTDFGFQTNMLKALSFNFVRPRLFIVIFSGILLLIQTRRMKGGEVRCNEVQKHV